MALVNVTNMVSSIQWHAFICRVADLVPFLSLRARKTAHDLSCNPEQLGISRVEEFK